jgi:diguanylate cyclase (GGDEF)-like protein
MTFRARLALFFLGVVALPLVVGAFAASHLSRTQALRLADSKLQVAAVTATTALQQERLVVERDLSPELAIRAAKTPTGAGLDAIRKSARLDFLVVVRDGGVAGSSIDLPPGLPHAAAAIEAGALRAVAAERRVVVRGHGGGTVLGGRIWRPAPPPSLDVQAALVFDGRRVGPGPYSPSGRPASVGDDRVVCVCRDHSAPAGLVLSTPTNWQGLVQWVQWPGIVLLVVGLAALVLVAYLLAGLLVRPLTKLALEAEALARGESEKTPAVDPTAGREFGQVERSLRSVSAELTGSREQLHQTRDQLAATERLTLIDPLTGVWNRRYIERALREQVKRHRRFQSPFGLLMIDVDRFKLINDEHGHAAGDAVLVEMARLIGRSIREDLDVVARFGGEEFVVVLPETDAPGTRVVAEKIRERIAGTAFQYDEEPIEATVSIGLAACPQDGIDGRRLLVAADAALYRAKATGRNRTVAASSRRRSREA